MEKVKIENVEIVLSHSDDLNIKWTGQNDLIRQIMAAWHIISEDDIPLNPRIVGKPGAGKTTLSYYAAKELLKREVYIFQCTVDTRPEDLIIVPVISENNASSGANAGMSPQSPKISYHASSLVSAMIKGGVAILDEGNRMSEKTWASLAPLLDDRRYVESVIAGIKIKAHPDFRIIVTMNDDASTFELPEYIHSRLQPTIELPFPDVKEEYDILKMNLPFAEEEILKITVGFLQKSHINKASFSVRDGINMARYAMKLYKGNITKDIDTAFLIALKSVLGEEGIKILSANNNEEKY